MLTGVLMRLLQAPLRAFRLRLRSELGSATEHGRVWRGAETFRPPKLQRVSTFLHGFLLPFTLLRLGLSDPRSRRQLLRPFFVRGAIVAGVGLIVAVSGGVHPDRSRHARGPVVVTTQATPDKPKKPVHVKAPGIQIDVDETGRGKSVVFGREATIEPQVHPRNPGEDADEEGDFDVVATAAPRGRLARVMDFVAEKWAYILAFLTMLSVFEWCVVFASRKWDDRTSFDLSRLVHTRPEDEVRPVPKLTFDPRWAYRKGKRKARGYAVFFGGFPLLALLRLVPGVGHFLFGAAVSVWGYYWLGIFTVAKSAHAWNDGDRAKEALPLRVIRSAAYRTRLLLPVRPYVRAWAWVTRDLYGPAEAFERTPAPFLGLALARALVGLPVVYLLFRPIFPVCAGRLLAEHDPRDRFSFVWLDDDVRPFADTVALGDHEAVLVAAPVDVVGSPSLASAPAPASARVPSPAPAFASAPAPTSEISPAPVSELSHDREGERVQEASPEANKAVAT